MNEKKNNVGGIIAAAFLTILLIPLMLLSMTISSLSGVLSQDNLQQVLESVDYRKLARKNDGFKELLDDYDLDTDTVSDIMSSDFAADLTEVYISDVIAAVSDPDADPKLDEDMLEDLVDDNMDELVRLVRDVAEDQTGAELSRADARELIEEAVSRQGDELLDALPDVQELELEELGEGPVGTLLNILFSKVLFWVMVVIVVLMEALICLCLDRWIRRCAWIGAVNLVPAGILLIASAALSVAVDAMVSSPEILVVEPVVQTAASELRWSALILAIVGAAFILASFVMRLIERSREAKTVWPPDNGSVQW